MANNLKDAIEAARKEWHRERDAKEVARQTAINANQAYWDQQQVEHIAHERYKHAKAVWRCGREFSITDPDSALMVWKLGNGGAQ